MEGEGERATSCPPPSITKTVSDLPLKIGRPASLRDPFIILKTSMTVLSSLFIQTPVHLDIHVCA